MNRKACGSTDHNVCQTPLKSISFARRGITHKAQTRESLIDPQRHITVIVYRDVLE